MKTICSLAASLLTYLTATAQGTVAFNSTGAQVLYYDPAYNGFVAVPVGSFTVGLYYGVAGTTDPSLLILLKTTGISPLPGRFIGGTVTTPATTAPGASAVFEVRAWSGPYASYEAAVASGDSSVGIGRSGLFNNPTGGGGAPPGPPQSLVFANILVPIIPEPSTIGLWLMGAMSMLLLGRRKLSSQATGKWQSN